MAKLLVLWIVKHNTFPLPIDQNQAVSSSTTKASAPSTYWPLWDSNYRLIYVDVGEIWLKKQMEMSLNSHALVQDL